MRLKLKSYLAFALAFTACFTSCAHGDRPPVDKVEASSKVEWTHGQPLGAIYDAKERKLYVMTPQELVKLLQEAEDRQIQEQLKEPREGEEK